MSIDTKVSVKREFEDTPSEKVEERVPTILEVGDVWYKLSPSKFKMIVALIKKHGNEVKQGATEWY